MASNAVCKACVLLEGLNKGIANLGIGKESRVRRQHEQRLIDTIEQQ
jgi:cytoplasmic tRNA 2-thiolation protein 1